MNATNRTILLLATACALAACEGSGDGVVGRGGKVLKTDPGHPGEPPVRPQPTTDRPVESVPYPELVEPPVQAMTLPDWLTNPPPHPGSADHYGWGEGLGSWIAGVSTDEAGNVYAIDEEAVYVQRPGDTGWTRTASGGQFDLGYPVLSVCGGAAGEVYLGFSAPEGGAPETITEEEKLQGDVDRMTLQQDGTLALAHHYQLQNSEVRWMDHTRIILSCRYIRSGSDAGDVIVGSNHGVSILRGDDFVDHRHAVWAEPNGSLAVGYVYGVNADPDGNVLFAGHWMYGILPPVPPVLRDFLDYGNYTWIHQGWAENWGSVQDPDELHAIVGDVSQQWLLVGSMGKGLAYGDFGSGNVVWRSVSGAPDSHIQDLETDGTGRIWVATDGHGLWTLDRTTFTFARVDAVPTWAKVLDVFVDERGNHRTVYAGTDAGLYVIHDP